MAVWWVTPRVVCVFYLSVCLCLRVCVRARFVGRLAGRGASGVDLDVVSFIGCRRTLLAALQGRGETWKKVILIL